MIKKKVCHVTSVHAPHDDRIFLKECRTLSRAGYETSLVAYGDSELVDGVTIYGLGQKPSSRKSRVFGGTKRIVEAAVELNADLYHLHDPELLLYVGAFKENGAKVIFDSHEDIPAQLRDKPWLPKSLRRVVSWLFGCYEASVLKRCDAVVAATSYIGSTLKSKSSIVIVVNNYPMLDDICCGDEQFSAKDAWVCYAGGISELRGERVMVDAVSGLDGIGLLIAGDVSGSGYDEADRMQLRNDGINYLGLLSRGRVNDVYARSIAGLVLLLPIENYINSLPIKMFEYMAAGLPVIASDFPQWRKIVENAGCGFCVDPSNTEAIRECIVALNEDREMAEKLGKRGRELVMARYNWDGEGKKLVDLYKRLLS